MSDERSTPGHRRTRHPSRRRIVTQVPREWDILGWPRRQGCSGPWVSGESPLAGCLRQSGRNFPVTEPLRSIPPAMIVPARAGSGSR